MRPASNLLILGASTRAAAFSALRAGISPVCADLFADADLQAGCPVHRLAASDYPQGFLQLPELDAPGPWLYTGGLENRPELIDALTRRRQRLWGNSGEVLRRVRSPSAVAEVLRRAGLPFPAVRTSAPPPADGRWLRKPLEGAGGSGIRVWDGRSVAPRRCYWQEYIAGDAYSAIYVGGGKVARLLGITRQLVGEPWLHAAPFHYCGSLGPITLKSGIESTIRAAGSALASAFKLQGLFGVDFILNNDIPYPVEVNPRYTASVEVIEYATGLQALALHRQVFETRAVRRHKPTDGRPWACSDAPRSPVVGKAILFGRAPLRFPGGSSWVSAADLEAMPEFADIPNPGTAISPGKPILTLLQPARTVEAALGELQRRAADLDRQFYGR